MRRLIVRLLSLVALSLAWVAAPALAEPAAPTFKREELQQLLAPIALYPDALLAQVLMASTYPLQVAQAARWQDDNAKLTGDALDKALVAKEWDPSVKSLVAVPSVLKMMSDKLEWTQKLGDAFLAQQADVMKEVQYLRAKAEEAGNLKSNKQQTVKKTESVIVIEPASPKVVYVPVYSPTVVYGSWWYPAYPPYYFAPPPGAAFVSGFFWGSAVAISANYWGWGRCDWNRADIDIDVNRYNNINVNRTQITSNTWKHDAKNRGPVPYRDQRTREQFGSKSRPVPATREARGFEGGKPEVKRDARPEGRRDVKPDTRPDVRPDARPDVKRDKSEIARERPGADGARRDDAVQKAKAKKPTAFDGGDAKALRSSSERGHKSRDSMKAHRAPERSAGRSAGGRR